MSPDPVDRDAALRRILVARATRAPRTVPWLAIVGTVGVVGMLAGLAIGATALRGPDGVPAVGPSGFDLPPFLTEDSVVLGTPTVVATSDAVTHEAGKPPAGASGLAVWVTCEAPGSFELELDGRWEGGGDCDGGAGGYWRYERFGPNVVRVTPSTEQATVWIAWVDRGDDTTPSATAEAALADGTVTEEEYRAGFDRFVACMADWGVTVGGGFWDGDRISYSLPGHVNEWGAEHECYGTEFRDLDIAWQISHQE